MRWGLTGHDAVIDLLGRALQTETLAHAYLITGPDGVGKTALALRLAQAVNCSAGSPAASVALPLLLDSPLLAGEGLGVRSVPCGECRSCTRIAAGRHPDVMTMTLGRPDLGYDPDRPNERDLGIGRVRALEHAASLRPFEGRSRVFIIDGAEHLSREAQNALLKTLEEPPPSVLLLLVTAEEDTLLPTIRSRVQRLALRLAGHAEIAAHLRERLKVSTGEAERLGRLAQGRIAWAIAAATDPEVLARRNASQAELLGLVTASVDQRFAWAASRAAEFSRNRMAVISELHLALDLWHDMFLLKAAGAESVSDATLVPALAAAARSLDVAALAEAVAAIRRAVSHLERNANPRLALEVLMLELPNPHASVRAA